MKVKFYLELEDGSDDTLGDFFGGPVVENPPSNAGAAAAGDMGSSPGQGTKIPHAQGQLDPCAPQLLSLPVTTKISCTATETQGSQK